MIVRQVAQVKDSTRHVETENWESTRLLLAGDGMGFSFHITTIYAGTTTPMHYRHHLEAVYCIAGAGELHDLERDERHQITPGVIYALDRHDRHELTATSDLQLACVFNPALQGREVHDANGVYPQAAQPVLD